MRDIPIVFESTEILIINKPAGVSVQGGEGVSHPLDEELSKFLGRKVHLVHRLDKETCGLLVVAKTPEAAARWTELIATKRVKKEYEAICFGRPVVDGAQKESGVIRSAVRKAGRTLGAETAFFVEETVPISLSSDDEETLSVECSRLRLVLGTGRMHQIRIHLASVGSPICGDDRHGDFKLNKRLKKSFKVKRLLLCAKKLTVPIGGADRTFEVDCPDSFYFWR